MSGQITVDTQALSSALPLLNFIGATLLVWFCWRELRRINRAAYELESYAFHNRTAGGTVKFQSFDAALEHRARRHSAAGNYLVLMFVGPAAIIWFFNAAIWFLETIN
jgi:hypothetical protein